MARPWLAGNRRDRYYPKRRTSHFVSFVSLNVNHSARNVQTTMIPEHHRDKGLGRFHSASNLITTNPVVTLSSNKRRPRNKKKKFFSWLRFLPACNKVCPFTNIKDTRIKILTPRRFGSSLVRQKVLEIMAALNKGKR